MKLLHSRIIFYVVPLVLLSGAGCKKSAVSAGGGDEEKAVKAVVQVSLSPVTIETIRTTLPITGTLSPLPDQEAKIAPPAPGRIQQINVKTGDQVIKGQIIAILEPGPLLGQIQQAEAVVRSSGETLLQTRLNLRSQISSQQAAVVQARSNLRAQQVAMQKLEAGARPQEIAQAQSAVTTAEISLANAEQNLSRSKTLIAQGLLARKDLEAAQAQEMTAKAALVSAKEALSLIKSGNRKEDLEAGRVAVSQAQDQLRAAEAQSVQNAAKEQDVHIAQRQLEVAEAALKSARTQLSALTIRSPLSGTVIGRTLNAGETVDIAGSIVTIANLKNLRLLLNIHAANLALVHIGESVEFSVEARPGVLYRAVIHLISRAVDTATNTVQAEALVNNDSRDLQDDGFVKGNIITASYSRAFTVPSSSVVEKDGKTSVFVAGSDKIAHLRPVTTGAQEKGRTEIRTGLHTSEQVITSGAYELEDGTKIKE